MAVTKKPRDISKLPAIAEPRPTPRPRSKGADEAKRIALAIAEAGLDKKALEVVIIDVTEKVDYADYVVVMSGRSDRQVGAICKGIEAELRDKHKVKCLAIEGLPQGQWALMDFADVIVHVFHEDVRGYYDLETLWMDAAKLHIEPGPPKKSPG